MNLKNINKLIIINKQNSYSFILAPIFGFSQSFAASIMFILTKENMPFLQFIFGIIYYGVLTINTKKMAFGSSLGILIFIISASLGFVIGTILTNFLT